MESNLNFKNLVNDPPAGRAPGTSPLTRQPSVYSLTFDEFQTTVGGAGKDFGSMNMDELLKSIWSAEDNHNFSSATAAGGGGPQGGTGYLQRQGSMILPRTLSQKTVDEVWKDMSKEYDAGGGEKDSNGHVSGFGVPHRQPTLGEITLEEFLVRAGVVREEPTPTAINNNNNNNVGLFGDLWHPVTSTNTNVGFGGVPEFSNSNLPLNVNGVRAGAAENHHFQQQQILPKPPVSVYGSQMGMRGGMGISNQAMSANSNGSVTQNAGLQGGGLGMVDGGSPAATYSSDGLTKSNGDMSPVSPMPYVFNGGLRGRRSAAVEKVVERRQRRMIKNRESAAKSRARKQAYTTELEEEVAKLKEEHEKLLKKQAEIMEMQKNQVLEMIKQQNGGGKRQCLRRTQTGPW